MHKGPMVEIRMVCWEGIESFEEKEKCGWISSEKDGGMG